jgi:hydrogenase small subunit
MTRKPGATVAAHLKRCGVPRREFLQFCTQLMVAAPWGLAITEK